MLFVGLTGGIGSGKSTAARMLADLGAVVLDADAFARDASASSSPQFPEIAALFGPVAVGPDGELDRAAVADIVFADPAKLRALETIIHPVVDERVREELDRYAGTDAIVVLDSPLLIQLGNHARCDSVVVVVCSSERQIERLLARGMREEDARARMAAQLSPETMAAHADHVLDNDGTVEELHAQVVQLWSDLQRSVSSAP
ncbi:MAG: dephospho-CoA kinase [Actinomycetota bacterium]|jgi:dephospho-CoA kinase|nr:dephospho-CoA kinase [Actinomycetota bacterium]